MSYGAPGWFVCGCLAGVLMSAREKETHKKSVGEEKIYKKKYDITQFQRVKRCREWLAL
jgi:predicted amino acid dehydrogenase